MQQPVDEGVRALPVEPPRPRRPTTTATACPAASASASTGDPVTTSWSSRTSGYFPPHPATGSASRRRSASVGASPPRNENTGAAATPRPRAGRSPVDRPPRTPGRAPPWRFAAVDAGHEVRRPRGASSGPAHHGHGAVRLRGDRDDQRTALRNSSSLPRCREPSTTMRASRVRPARTGAGGPSRREAVVRRPGCRSRAPATTAARACTAVSSASRWRGGVAGVRGAAVRPRRAAARGRGGGPRRPPSGRPGTGPRGGRHRPRCPGLSPYRS